MQSPSRFFFTSRHSQTTQYVNTINSHATYHTAMFAHIIKNPYICESATQQIEILKTVNTKSTTDHIPVA